MRFKAVLLSLLFVLAFLTPSVALASNTSFFGPIIDPECLCKATNSAPDWGCILQTVQNLINFAISFAVLASVLAMAYAGALWMFSPFHAENRQKGRTMLLNVAIGLAIVLAGWLVVDFAMKTLYRDGAFGPWNRILSGGTRCIVGAPAPSNWLGIGGGGPSSGAGSSNSGSSNLGGSSSCSACVTLSSLGIANKGTTNSCGGSGACVPSGGCDGVPAQNPPVSDCQVQGALGQKLRAALVSGMWVTEAWPPTRNHANTCHMNGTCVDADFQDNRNDAASIIAFLNSADAQGLGAVYELPSQSECNALVNAGVPSNRLDYVAGITGAHFSVYSSPVGTQPGCQ